MICKLRIDLEYTEIVIMKFSLKSTPARKESGIWIVLLAGFTVWGWVAGCNSTVVIKQIQGPTQALFTATPVLPTVTSTPNTHYDFKLLIADMERNMPAAYSDGFSVPTKSDEQAFQSMALDILNGNIAVPAASVSSFHYELAMLFDQGDTGAESYVLREQQPIQKGWGLFFFRKYASQNIVVEAPHPVTDDNTPEVALDLYRALQAKALIVAGANRDANIDNSADPAHAPDTIFQAIHIALFRLAGLPDKKTIFLQIHGYSISEHSNIPQVVIGYNWQNDLDKDLLISKIVSALQDNNITVGLCSGKKYQGLCGTTNVQRLVTEGGVFIHMELSRSLRNNDLGLVRALRQALTP